MQELQIEFVTEGPGSVLRDCLITDQSGNVLGRLPSRGFSVMAGAHDPVVYSVEVPGRNVRVENK